MNASFFRNGTIAGLVLLAACSSNPPTPDWQTNALGAMRTFTSMYLSGNSQAANDEFVRARGEIAATGRPDLVARAELVRCAAHVASLVLDNCAAVPANAPDLAPPERAYALYLNSAQKSALDAAHIALLPEQHRPLFGAKEDGARVATLAAMRDPLARLVAAGVLFQQGQLAPDGVALAVDTASEQGWRRPLLAWLGVQLKLAEGASDLAGKARIQRRIDLASGAATGYGMGGTSKESTK